MACDKFATCFAYNFLFQCISPLSCSFFMQWYRGNLCELFLSGIFKADCFEYRLVDNCRFFERPDDASSILNYFAINNVSCVRIADNSTNTRVTKKLHCTNRSFLQDKIMMFQCDLGCPSGLKMTAGSEAWYSSMIMNREMAMQFQCRSQWRHL